MKFFNIAILLLAVTLLIMTRELFSIHPALAQIQMKPFYPTVTPTPIGGIPPTSTPIPPVFTSTPTPPEGVQPTRPPQNTVECLVNTVSETAIKQYIAGLVDNDATPEVDEAQNRYSRSQGNITEAAYIRSHFMLQGLQTTLQGFDQTCPRGNVTSGNNIGVLRGNGTPNEAYLLVAHMDTLTPNPAGPQPGADRDASGTALVMEAVRVFRTCNFTPKRSIEFIAFSGGEEGQLGSNYYVQHYMQSERSTKTIKGVFNLDSIANVSPDGQSVVFSYNPSRPGAQLANKVKAMKERFNLPITIGVTSSSSMTSDHAPFINQNIPATFGYETTRSQYYNTQDDKPSKPGFSYSQIASTTKAVVAALAELANE